jgi:hypothetical protein
MDFDALTTGIIFVAIVVLGTVGSMQTPMSTDSVLMMVLPSMVVFGLIMLVLGVKHGEYRAGTR